jgi:hypothetical protein
MTERKTLQEALQERLERFGERMPDGSVSMTPEGWAAYEAEIKKKQMAYVEEAADDHERADRRLAICSSYERTTCLVEEMSKASASRRLSLFLEHGNMCDAPWAWRSVLAGLLRLALTEVKLVDHLEPDARAWFSALPSIVPIWRGCDWYTVRGLHWTTNREVAAEFAQSKRCTNHEPTLVQAVIPKEHIFAVFVNRNENEIVVDPRRLRQLKTTRQPKDDERAA